MKNTNKEVQLLYIQLYGSIIFIIAIFISIILTYNNILKQTQNRQLFKNKNENNITLTNRIILTILTIIFTYINYEFYIISKQKSKGTLQLEELIASIFTLIASFILLYTTTESIKNNTQTNNTDTPLI